MENIYIGARYVPLFYTAPDGSNAWTANVQYEALTVVTDLNQSYTSKIPVPASVGRPSENPDYWILTGAYNAQVEQYRQEVESVSENITALDTEIDTLSGNIQELRTALSNDIRDLEDTFSPARNITINNNRKIIFIGDSYIENYTSNWATFAGRYVAGEGNYYISGVAGAGFTAGTTFLQQLSSMTISDPDTITDVVVAGGANDAGASGDAIGTAMTAFANYVRSNFPNAALWVGFLAWSSVRSSAATFHVAYNRYRNGALSNRYKWLVNCEYILHNYGYLDITPESGSHPNATGCAILGNKIAEALLSGSCSTEVYSYHQINAANEAYTISAYGDGTSFLQTFLMNDIVTINVPRILFQSSIAVPAGTEVLIGTYSGNGSAFLGFEEFTNGRVILPLSTDGNSGYIRVYNGQIILFISAAYAANSGVHVLGGGSITVPTMYN